MSATHASRVGVALLLASCGIIPALVQTADGQESAVKQVRFEAALPEELPFEPNVLSSQITSPTYALSLEEAKSRALQSSPIMDLASLQISAKCHALQAARKDFLPKLLQSIAYFRFDEDLGSVLTTPGVLQPAQSVAVPIVEEDTAIYTAAAIQPITPLLKVREAVNISAADVGAARAQKEFARRELIKGVEQLYLGMIATKKIKSGLEQAVAGAQQMAAADQSPAAQISLIQAQQGLLAVDGQLVELTEQMNALVDLPPQTQLALDELPPPNIPFETADEVATVVLSSSPKIREARRQVDKAEAALRLAHADYVPSVMAYGLYVNQESTPTIQEDFTGVGVTASYLLEWGKKNDNYRAGMATVALARQSLRKEMQDAVLNAMKAYHTAVQAGQALDYATRLAELQRQVQPPAGDTAALKAAVQARLEAEIASIKADLDYRNAVVELLSIAGRIE